MVALWEDYYLLLLETFIIYKVKIEYDDIILSFIEDLHIKFMAGRN